MVPSPVEAPPPRRVGVATREKALEAPVEAFLAPQGYRMHFDPDGSGYFDAVAQRGEELGLVELKVADWRRVFEQALVRRGWADWVAVLLPRPSLAARVLSVPGPPPAQRVGVWTLREGRVEVLRPARSDGPRSPAFRGLKLHLQESLRLLDSGLLPPGTDWRLVRHRGPRSRGRRQDGREWKLDEFDA